MDAHPAVPIVVTLVLVCVAVCLLWMIWSLAKEVRADKKRQAGQRLAAKQDPSADDHRFRHNTLVGDTIAWLARRGGTWEPVDPHSADLTLRVHQEAGPDVTVHPGDTLHWDGERITVQSPSA